MTRYAGWTAAALAKHNEGLLRAKRAVRAGRDRALQIINEKETEVDAYATAISALDEDLEELAEENLIRRDAEAAVQRVQEAARETP